MKPQDILKNFQSFWDSLEKQARIGFAAGVSAIVIVVIVLGIWIFGSSYGVLFSDMDTRDAATVVEELQRMKVPYKIEDGGTKILVEEKRVHETRLRLMAQGAALNGGVGFEIFDNKDAGMTEYSQKINYQRALQGELARTIMSIEQVRYARVHLVVAESGLFRRDKTKPKASVSLVLKSGARLSPDQIAGIQRLVGAAVPNLEPGMVTVLDQRGVTLSPEAEADENVAAVSGKLKLKKTTEDYLARKIGQVMDATFGPGQAIVSVDATLNFDEVHRTLQNIIPLKAGSSEEAGAVVRKRQSTYRQPRGTSAKPVDGETPAGDNSPYVTSTTEVEYEIGKSVEQIVSAPGSIRRISVGVIVPAQLGEAQVERVRSIVRMAMGFNAERGDEISIQPIDQLVMHTGPVDHGAPLTDTESGNGAAGPAMRVLRYVAANPLVVVGGLLVVGILIVLAVAALRRGNAPRAIGEVSALSEAQRQQLLAEVQTWLASERGSSEAKS
jgi:flagellar M-ring protein FliF